MLMCTTKIVYKCLIMPVLEFSNQWQVRHLKNNLYRLVIKSTLLIIVFNSFNTIMITESWFIKEKWVSCSKQSQNHLLKKTDDYFKKYQTTNRDIGGKWYTYQINVKLPPINKIRLSKKEQIKEENQRKYPQGQWSLEWFEVPIALE